MLYILNDELDLSLSLEGKARELLAWFEDKQPRGSFNRIRQISKITLKNARRAITPQDVDYLTILQAFQDVQEMWAIVRILDSDLPTPRFADSLSACLKGVTLPADEKKGTRQGRDYQFELYVAACAKHSGFKINRPNIGNESHDWDMSIQGKNWAIECKRPRFMHTLSDNIKQAREQLNKADRGGVIFVDANQLAERAAPHMQYHTPEELAEKNQNRIHNLGDAYMSCLRQQLATSSVGLVILYDCYPVAPPDGFEDGWNLSGFWTRFLIRNPSEAGHDHFMTFADTFHLGVPGSQIPTSN